MRWVRIGHLVGSTGVCVPSWRHHILPTEFHELPASALGQHGTALVCHRWVLYRQAIGLELIFFFPMYQCSIHKAGHQHQMKPVC
nr:hypothetical protein Iba_chr10fCG5100 [Ipomoea batatas]